MLIVLHADLSNCDTIDLQFMKLQYPDEGALPVKGATFEVRLLVKESILLPRVLKEIEYLRSVLRIAAALHKEESLTKLNRAWKLAHRDLQKVRSRMNDLEIHLLQTKENERTIKYRYSYNSNEFTGTYSLHSLLQRINLRVRDYLESQ